MYGFASDYHPPHHIVRPNVLNLKLGADGLESHTLVKIQRDDAGIAPEKVAVVPADVLVTGL